MGKGKRLNIIKIMPYDVIKSIYMVELECGHIIKKCLSNLRNYANQEEYKKYCQAYCPICKGVKK